MTNDYICEMAFFINSDCSESVNWQFWNESSVSGPNMRQSYPQMSFQFLVKINYIYLCLICTEPLNGYG